MVGHLFTSSHLQPSVNKLVNQYLRLVPCTQFVPLPRRSPQPCLTLIVILWSNGMQHGHGPLQSRRRIRHRKIRHWNLSSQRHATGFDGYKFVFLPPYCNPQALMTQSRFDATNPLWHPRDLRPRGSSHHLQQSRREIRNPYELPLSRRGIIGRIKLPECWILYWYCG
jgi:hypothetical protein